MKSQSLAMEGRTFKLQCLHFLYKAWEFPNQVVSNQVARNFYAETLFCDLLWTCVAFFCVHLRVSANDRAVRA